MVGLMLAAASVGGMQSSLPDAVPSAAVVSAGPSTLGLIPGEGIGPELTRAAERVLDALEATGEQAIRRVYGPPLERVSDGSLPLTSELTDWYTGCRTAGIPVLHGPAGGRFVYDLRRWGGLFVKLTPVQPLAALADASLLRPERVANADVLLVRDNSGGLYQGEALWEHDGDVAAHRFQYERSQIVAVIDVAVAQAAARRGQLTVVTKPGGIPTISALWSEVATERAADAVELRFLEVDNACYQLASDPRQFDVIVSPNMFGDVLGDTAAIALGSRGLSFSANFALDGFAVYQTAHGAAYDLAGRDVANPIGHLSSLAWLLERSLERAEAARRLRAAIAGVLVRGIRTADIASNDSTVVGTSAFIDEVCREIEDRHS
ncbi:MAG TPA: isocitrate/isopropylmalate family dehydrogenase [Microbacteriaceae bacterium]|nr:isocitrate/isopropylmalate family dehydrogenase [Microbacteriaceae bacterium]